MENNELKNYDINYVKSKVYMGHKAVDKKGKKVTWQTLEKYIEEGKHLTVTKTEKEGINTIFHVEITK
jgi:hypothetical protein